MSIAGTLLPPLMNIPSVTWEHLMMHLWLLRTLRIHHPSAHALRVCYEPRVAHCLYCSISRGWLFFVLCGLRASAYTVHGEELATGLHGVAEKYD